MSTDNRSGLDSVRAGEIDLAAEWRRGLAARAATAPTVEKNFLGFRCTMRRLPIAGWYKSGRMPQAVAVAMYVTQKSGDPAAAEKALTPDELRAVAAFERDAICSAVVKPRIISEGEPGPGEIAYDELVEECPDLVAQIMGFIYANSPGVPVRTTEGETTLEAVETFREERSLSGVRGDVPDVRADAEQPSGNS
jgi:hypothetical protein